MRFENSTLHKLINIIFTNINGRKMRLDGIYLVSIVSISAIIESIILSSIYFATSKLSSGITRDDLPVFGTLSILALLSTILKYAAQSSIFKYSNKIGTNITNSNFRKIVRLNLDSMMSLKKSNIITTSTTDLERLIVHLVSGFFQSFASLISGIAIVLTLVFNLGNVGLLALAILSSLYISLTLGLRPITKKIGNTIRINTSKNEEILHENLENFKLTLVELRQKYSEAEYNSVVKPLRSNIADLSVLKILPKLLIEGFSLFMLFMIGIIFALNNHTSFLIIPFIGTLSVGIQKILPSINYLYSFFASLSSYSYTILSLENLLSNDNDFAFKNDRNIVQLHHEETENCNLMPFSCMRIEDEMSVGGMHTNIILEPSKSYCIRGDSGCGKTTLLDSIAMIRKLKNRRIYIDSNELTYDKETVYNWRKNILYLVQNPIPIDIKSSDYILRKCKIYGLNDISNEVLISTAKRMRADHLLEKNCKILSGGELQRINLCFSQIIGPPIILMDECTSALQEELELELLSKFISHCSKSMILSISHRPLTFALYDRIIDL